MMTNCPGYWVEILLQSKARSQVYTSELANSTLNVFKSAFLTQSEKAPNGAGDAT